MKRLKKRGLAVSFVSKTRVRRFIAEENLQPLRCVVPDGFWQALDDVVINRVREELSRGQMALPI